MSLTVLTGTYFKAISRNFGIQRSSCCKISKHHSISPNERRTSPRSAHAPEDESERGVDVPPREEQTVFIPLTEIQRFWYLREVGIKAEEDSTSASASIAYANGRKQVLELLQEHEAVGSASANDGTAREFSSRKQTLGVVRSLLLRDSLFHFYRPCLCCCPYAIRNVEPEPYFLGEHIVASSSKLIAIDKILAEILPKVKKVLIFSQRKSPLSPYNSLLNLSFCGWYRMLDVLQVEDMMCLWGINYARLDGSTAYARRSPDIKLHERSSVYFLAMSCPVAAAISNSPTLTAPFSVVVNPFQVPNGLNGSRSCLSDARSATYYSDAGRHDEMRVGQHHCLCRKSTARTDLELFRPLGTQNGFTIKENSAFDVGYQQHGVTSA
ncbi:hypothetical protein D9757_001434 [Collybiopsis confluens]|uniref:Uncharacterized protein n=1 Tax=Collybiopsis confluens TaxID=2823264 RepID=A0A8H5HZ82_9AGAR|nr:hypothetical protein D9757_001434 [Collybiopsis confluens]